MPRPQLQRVQWAGQARAPGEPLLPHEVSDAMAAVHAPAGRGGAASLAGPAGQAPAGGGGGGGGGKTSGLPRL
jgi:hypothetical protein